jgi:RNA polymerase sigma-70 factor, ECF subfamily
VDFNNWAETIRPKLIRLAVSQLKDEHEAEDVVQDTLTILWRRGPEGISNLDAYAARSVWQNAAQKRARRRDALPLETKTLKAAGFDEPATREAVEDQLQTWDIEAAIGNLSEPQQEVVRLHYYGGLSFREIGEALKISMNTAASRCRYALDQLGHALSAYKKGDSDGR